MTSKPIHSRKKTKKTTQRPTEALATDCLTRDPAELYRALVNASPDGIVIADIRGRIDYVSPATLKILELEGPEQVVGTSVLEWIELEDQARVAEHLRNAAQNVISDDNQYRFHTVHGRRFIGEINAALVHDSAGAPTGLIANLRDVTDRFMANEALAASEGKLRRMVQSSPVGMHFYRLEAENRLVLEDANPAADRILGIQHVDLIGKTIEKAFPGLNETEIPFVYRRLAAHGGQWRTDQIVYEQGIISGAYEVVAFQSYPGHMVASFTDVTRRKRAEAELKERNEELRTSIEHEQMLRTLDKLIIQSNDIQTSVNALLRPIIDYFKADAAEILIYQPDTKVFYQAGGIGFISDEYLLPISTVDGTVGLALATRRTVCQPDLLHSNMRMERPEFLLREKFISGYAALLETPSRLHGVLQLFYRSSTVLTPVKVNFFEMVAGQVAIAIEKATLWENHQKALSELVAAYESTLEGWVYALDLRDKETENHTRRVTDLTVAVAGVMGIDPTLVMDFRRGALLHDIGKMGIPDEILHKPGSLNESEWGIMHRHPELARRMLEPIEYLRRAIDIPYCHHERWNGSGYPRGLKGAQIPLAARIFAVVDVWDALTSDRPYRKAWTKEQSASYLNQNAGVLFDPAAVKALFCVVGLRAE